MAKVFALKSVSKAMYILCICEALLAIAIIVLASLPSADEGTKARYAICIVGLLCSSVLGSHGAYKHNEVSIRFFFVFQVWALSVLSIWLINTFDIQYLLFVDCTSITSGSCGDAGQAAIAKLVIACFSIAATFLGSYLGLEMWDRLNDLESTLLRGKTGIFDRMNRDEVQALN